MSFSWPATSIRLSIGGAAITALHLQERNSGYLFVTSQSLSLCLSAAIECSILVYVCVFDRRITHTHTHRSSLSRPLHTLSLPSSPLWPQRHLLCLILYAYWQRAPPFMALHNAPSLPAGLRNPNAAAGRAGGRCVGGRGWGIRIKGEWCREVEEDDG